ncbi:MAG: YlbF family regulator, partial [Bacillota bacterium]
MDKAHELADAIANSPELAKVRETEIAMGQDPEAQKIIGEFQ